MPRTWDSSTPFLYVSTWITGLCGRGCGPLSAPNSVCRCTSALCHSCLCTHVQWCRGLPAVHSGLQSHYGHPWFFSLFHVCCGDSDRPSQFRCAGSGVVVQWVSGGRVIPLHAGATHIHSHMTVVLPLVWGSPHILQRHLPREAATCPLE